MKLHNVDNDFDDGSDCLQTSVHIKVMQELL